MEISVLLAVYKNDNEKMFHRCIESVLCQSVLPIQIVCVVDGEVPSALQAALENVSFHQLLLEKGIEYKLIYLPENRGLANALNVGLQNCAGFFIARIDPDDWMDADRLMKQRNYFLKNLHVDVLGTGIKLVNENGIFIKNKSFPASEKKITTSLYLKNPVAHTSVMFKKSFIKKIGGYPNFRTSQDWALWGKVLVNGGHIANLPSYLTYMTTGHDLFCRRGLPYFKGERKVLGYLHDINVITHNQKCVSLLLRLVSRVVNSLRCKIG